MSPPAKLYVVSPDAPAAEESATEAEFSATVPLIRWPVLDAPSPQPELPPEAGFEGVKQARAHADAVARLQLETETLRHTEAILATDLLAAVERETMEIAELNAKAEQRVQAIATARVEDARTLQLEINARAVAEARARVVLRRRIAEEQRLQQAAQLHAEADAEATRLTLQRGDAEAAAAKRETERRDAEHNASVLAQQRLALTAEAAAAAAAHAALEREALQSTQRRLAAEERKRDMQAKRVELEQRAAQQALRRAGLEAELALAAKRRADADMFASEGLAARVAAEFSYRQTSPGPEGGRMDAANQEQWAAAEGLVGDEGNLLAGNIATDETPESSVAANAEPEVRPQQRIYLRWSMAGVGAIALIVALAVPQFYRYQVTGQIAGRVGQDLQGAGEFSAQAESTLQGLKMTDRLSSVPDKAR